MKKNITLLMCVLLLYHGVFNVYAETGALNKGQDTGVVSEVTSGDGMLEEVTSGNAESSLQEMDQAEESSLGEAGLTNDNESIEEYYSYTDVGPFLAPVFVGQSQIRAYSLYSLMAADEESNDSGDSSTTVDAEGLVTSKSVTNNSDGTYTINIEAYATGTIKTETVTTSTPCDIVLVLDLSRSMDSGFGTTTRIAALKSAVKNFITSVAAQYDAATSDHRICIIGYNSSASVKANWTYVDSGGSSSLQSKVTNLEQSTGTNTHLGLATAYSQLTANYNYNGSNTTRQKVVVLFTDGVPGTSQNNFNESAAATAITNAKTIKDGGATVYSVAIYSGANPATAVSSTPSNNPAKINAMLHAISSNYPDATATSNGDTLNVNFGEGGNNGYYLTADSADDLEDIFQSISNNIQSGGSSVDLGSSAVVKDIVTPYFTMPDNAGDITVKRYDCLSYAEATGAVTWSSNGTALTDAVTIDTASRTIGVTGFDFSSNFVSEKGRVEGDVSQEGNFHGRKLVITFTVKPEEDFLGGNVVPTNGSTSGVYDGDGNLIENLRVPVVDVEVKEITPSAQNQYIYLTNTASLTELLNGFDSRIDGLNNDFVSISYTIKDGDTVIGTYEIAAGATSGTWILADGKTFTPTLEASTDYIITCTVTPIYSGTYSAITGSNTAFVYVFKPEITWQDSQINVGETADYANNYVGCEWKNEALSETASNYYMRGTVPTLIYEYDPEAATFVEDTPVDVTVKVGNIDITENVTFVHLDCDFDDCSWKEVSGKEFIVHIKSFNLVITKKGCDNTLDPEQTFIFTVKGPDGFEMEVAIVENGSVTITGLPVGEYTVTEQTDWSWRYTPDKVTQTVEIVNIKNGEANVVFQNERSIYWLDGNAACKNLFNIKKEQAGNAQ